MRRSDASGSAAVSVSLLGSHSPSGAMVGRAAAMNSVCSTSSNSRWVRRACCMTIDTRESTCDHEPVRSTPACSSQMRLVTSPRPQICQIGAAAPGGGAMIDASLDERPRISAARRSVIGPSGSAISRSVRRETPSLSSRARVSSSGRSNGSVQGNGAALRCR